MKNTKPKNKITLNSCVVNVFNKSGLFSLDKKLKETLTKVTLISLGKFAKIKIEVNIVFVDDKKIRSLNKRFLNKTAQTDVIGFNYCLNKKPLQKTHENIPFGDIFVCADVAKRQAKNLGHSLKEELIILTVHGALHLTGLDDKTPAQKLKMQKKTKQVLGKLMPKHQRVNPNSYF